MNEAHVHPSATSVAGSSAQAGLTFSRRFSTAGVSPYDELQWEHRTASIADSKGNTIFEQKDVDVPIDWSMTATNIVASKYLHGHVGTPQGEFGARETGVRQLVARVAETIRDWGIAGGYFATPEDAAAILGSLTTRSSDIDFWPNIDYLATKSPTSQNTIVNVDLNNDNVWLMDKATATVFGALGVCGIIPCPGHNAGHFAFSHTVAVDSKGNIYLAETITGRRIQKFVQVRSTH